MSVYNSLPAAFANQPGNANEYRNQVSEGAESDQEVETLDRLLTAKDSREE
jgi:hypothetical protein